MHRHVGAEMLDHPAGHLVDLPLAIVLAGDDQVGDFEPDIGLVLEITQRVEHRAKLALGHGLVEILGEGFQVDICRIDIAEESGPRLVRQIACRHHDRLHPRFPAGNRHVVSIFMEDDRIVIGEGDGAAAELGGGPGNRLRLRLGLHRVHLAALRGVVVLAEIAGQIAARRAERQHRRAGQEMVQRLLLDRIDAEARGSAIGGQHDPVVLPCPHETQPARTFLQLAISRAQLALDPPVIQQAPEFCLDNRPLALERRRRALGKVWSFVHDHITHQKCSLAGFSPGLLNDYTLARF